LSKNIKLEKLDVSRNRFASKDDIIGFDKLNLSEFVFNCTYATNIKIDYNLKGFGWAKVNFELNELKLSYRASYIGDNPLTEIFRIAVEILNGPSEKLSQINSPNKFDNYQFYFDQEGGIVEIHFKVQSVQNRIAEIKIIEKDYDYEEDAQVKIVFCGTIDFHEFIKQALISATKVLKEYGFIKYLANDWGPFPIENYLKILRFFEGDNKPMDIYEEINLLMKTLSSQGD